MFWNILTASILRFVCISYDSNEFTLFCNFFFVLIESANGNCSLKRKNSNSVNGADNPPGLTEKDVGITQYVSNLDGFTGIIKHR